MDKIKVAAYYLILNYSTQLCETKTKEFQYIKKCSNKIMNSTRLIQNNKTELISRLRNIKEICDNMTRTSHEILAYIAIDFLVNVERDTTARGKFSHLNILAKLDRFEKEYPEDLKQHYIFFSKIVDDL